MRSRQASSAGRSRGSLRPGLLACLGLALVTLAPGCRAEQALNREPLPQAPPAPDVLTHWPVPEPPAVTAERPVLWVALAAHLGPKAASAAATTLPLVLTAAAGTIDVVDATGRRVSAPRLELRWRAEPLPRPIRLRRTVLGPFPSFETAEQAALSWRQQGVEPRIAHPGDWEVWAPADTPAPPGHTARAESQQLTARSGLVLASPGGPKPLQGPLEIRVPGGLRWGDGVFRGPFRLQSDAYGSWSLVEQVPLERYLQGVVPHEIGAGAPAAALAAQAVLARTWALRNSHRFAVDGYHLCADTQCQVYGDPRQAGPAVRTAITTTAGRVLSWQGRPIHAVYHATNGGVAAGFEEVWRGEPLPYLQAFADGPAPFVAAYPLPLDPARALPALLQRSAPAGYGADHPRYRWQRRLDRQQIRQALGPAGRTLGEVRQLAVLERGPSGRVLALAITGSAGRQVLRLDGIRRSLRQLPSTLFSLTPEGPGVWCFSGGGFGHGAGLSQAGAIDLAARGWSLERILARYYPGTALVPIGSPGSGL